MKVISGKILDKLSTEALNSPRKRKNLNYHDSLDDTLQRLLNAMEPGTYVQPHKHEQPDKREFFLILRGKAVVILFNDEGDITSHSILDPTTDDYGIEIPEKTWHTIVILEKNTVLFEVKDGPYKAMNDKDFASWAPKEGDPGCSSFNDNLLKRIGIL